jgi:hypothetical protein
MSKQQVSTFQEMDQKQQEKLLRVFTVFPAHTTYLRAPSLDQFLDYTRSVKKHLGYSLDDIWNIYSGWSDVPADLHAFTSAIAASCWPKVTIAQYPGVIGFMNF